MRDHEIELIAALVEGRLEDETEARALIASSPEYQEEYEAQKRAHEVLRWAGTAAMTESERASLHRDVWTELQAGPGQDRPATPWYYRWAPVAAGLLVVVGLVAVLSQASGGEDAAEPVIAADAPAATTSTAAASEEAPADDALRDETDTETTSGADGDADQSYTESGGFATDAAVAIYEREAERLRQGVFGSRLRPYESTNIEVEACVEDAGLGEHRVLATLSAPLEDTEGPEDETRVAIAYPEDAQLDDGPLSFVDLDTCEVVYTDE